MLRATTFTLFCLASLPVAQRAAVSELIDHHRRLKNDFQGRSQLEQEIFLHGERVNAHRLDAEEVVFYVDAPLPAEDRQALAALGVEVHPEIYVPAMPPAHPLGFHPAVVPYDRVAEVAANPRIRRIDSIELRHLPMNDVATELTKIDDVQGGLFGGVARDGSGIKIAIADSGLDWTHPDIPTPAEAFDMTDGTGVGTWGTNVFNTVTDHGTHVTGIAVGSGSLSGGDYAGAAPGATLHFYKIGSDCTSQSSTTNQIEALTRATLTGCRVYSMSYGTAGPFRDGSGAFQQTVDWAFNEGTVSFISAGNAGASGFHDWRIVEPEGEGVLQLTYDNTDSTSAWTGTLNLNLLWIATPVPNFQVSLAVDNLGAGESLAQIWFDVSSRGTQGRSYQLTGNVPAGQMKTYELRIANDLTTGDPTKVHVFTWGAQFATAKPDTTIGGGLADKAVCVGAWVHRNQWQDAGGGVTFTGETIDSLASFSSRGPRIDGLLRPDVCAYGADVISVLDSGGFTCPSCNPAGCTGTFPAPNRVIDNDGLPGGPANYYVLPGTSMACPMAAGAACLLLEESPTLTPAELVEAMREGGHQSNAPDSVAGYGVIRMDTAYEFVQLGVIWVNFAAVGVMTGTYFQPFDTLAAAMAASPPGSTIKIQPGSTSETATITSARSIRSYEGTAVVGE